MLVRVRTGYGYTKGNKNYSPGDVVELTEEEHKKKHWIFDPVESQNKDVSEPKVEKRPEEEPVLENRAVLDSKAGAPLIRRGSRKK